MSGIPSSGKARAAAHVVASVPLLLFLLGMRAWADRLPAVGAMNGARLPQLPGDQDRRNLQVGPPIALVAGPMQFAMMRAAKRTVNSSLTFRPSERGRAIFR